MSLCACDNLSITITHQNCSKNYDKWCGSRKICLRIAQ